MSTSWKKCTKIVGGRGQFNVNKQTKFIPDAFSKKCKKVYLCEEFKEPSARGEKEHETFHLNFPCDFIPLIQYWILNCGMSLTSEFTIILKPHSFILPTYFTFNYHGFRQGNGMHGEEQPRGLSSEIVLRNQTNFSV